MFKINHISSLFTFLQRNSVLNLSLAAIIFCSMQMLGITYSLRIQTVTQTTSIVKTFIDLLSIPISLRFNSLVAPNFLIQLDTALTIIFPLISIWLIKTFTPRPPHFTSKALIVLIQLYLFFLVFILAPSLQIAMIIQITNVFNGYLNGASMAVSVILVILSIILELALLLLQILYCVSFEDHKFSKPYQFGISHYFITQLCAQLILFVLYIQKSIEQYVFFTIVAIYLLFLLCYITYKKFFALTRSAVVVYCCIIYSLSFSLQNCVAYIMAVQLSIVYDENLIFATTSAMSLIIAISQYQKMNEPFIQMSDDAVVQHKNKATINYGLSKEFVLDMACFCGPEFVGVLSSQGNDVLNNTAWAQLTHEECEKVVRQAKNAEERLEALKMVYENIFANIYYSYACCGQAMECLTMLDIEEALPVPVLLKHARNWRTPQDALASILNAISEVKQVDEILQVDGNHYTPVGCMDFVHRHGGQEYTLRQILKRNCVDVNSVVSRIDHVDQVHEKGNRDNKSVNPERALWHNSYELPSDQRVPGTMFLLSKQDCDENSHVFKHLSPRDGELVFVYVPSHFSKSIVTGNLHRLSFCSDQASMRTAQLRRLRWMSIISFARTIFPLDHLVDQLYRFPLVNQYRIKFQTRAPQKFKLTKGIRTSYTSNFSIEVVERASSFKNSKCLYAISNYLSNSVNPEHVDATMLQYILVEFFVQKLALTRQATARIRRYLDLYYDAKITAFQKLQQCQNMDSPNQLVLTKIRENNKQNLSDQVVYNALAVVYGCGVIDRRVNSVEEVVKALEAHQFFVTSHSYSSYLVGYVEYQLKKFKLYQMNYQTDMKYFFAIVKYLDELQRFQEILQTSLKTYSQQHYDVTKLVVNFVEKYQRVIVDLLSLKCQDKYGTDQLQLIEFIDEAKKAQDDDHVQYQEYGYKSTVKIHAELQINGALKPLVQPYHFVKLSNLVSMLHQQFYVKYCDEDAAIENPFKKSTVINSSLQALSVINQILSISIISDAGHADHSSLSNSSSSFSSSSDSYDSYDTFQTKDSSTKNDQAIFDINLKNPRSLEDYISIVNSNYYNKNTEFIVFFNHEPSQNTPEFVINAIRGMGSEGYVSNAYYISTLQILTDLHFIKLNDKSSRNTNTMSLIIPRIQAMQSAIEKMIISFLKNLVAVKQEQTSQSNVLLLQAMNSIHFIESQITKLFQARIIVLRREHLSSDHILQMRDELYRACNVTYGLPTFSLKKDQSLKDQLQRICSTYAGNEQEYQNIIMHRIMQLPRCGGVYMDNPSYKFIRHKSWNQKFAWETENANLEFQALQIKSGNNSIVVAREEPADAQVPVVVEKQQVPEVNQKQKKKCGQYNCFKLLWPTILMILLVIVGYAYRIFQTISNRNVNEIANQVVQQLSQSIFNLQTMGSTLLLTSKKPNFVQSDYAEFQTSMYTQFANINDKMFESYLYVKGILTNKKSSEIYQDEITNKMFQFNLSNIFDIHDPIQCDSNSIQLIRQQEKKLTNIIQFVNIINTGKHGYKNILASTIQSRQVYGHNFTMFLNDQQYDVQMYEAILLLIQYCSCYSQQLLFELQNDAISYQMIVDNINHLQVTFQQVLYPVYDIQTSNYSFLLDRQQWEWNNVLYFLFIILFICQWFQITQNISNNIINADLDKGSVISNIARIPIDKLQQMIQKYHNTIKLKNNDTFNHSSYDYQQNNKSMIVQAQSTQLAEYLKFVSQLFKTFNHKYYIYFLIIGSLSYIISAKYMNQYFEFPYKYETTNILNKYQKVDIAYDGFVPSVAETLKSDPNLPIQLYIAPIDIRIFRNQVSSQLHPLIYSLTFIENWISFFDSNQIKLKTLNTFISTPFPQILYIQNFIQVNEQIVAKNKRQGLIYELNQTYQYACQVYLKQIGSALITDNTRNINAIYTQYCSNTIINKPDFASINKQFNSSVFTSSWDLKSPLAFYVVFYVCFSYVMIRLIYKIMKWMIIPLMNKTNQCPTKLMITQLICQQSTVIFTAIIIIITLILFAAMTYQFEVYIQFFISQNLTPSKINIQFNQAYFQCFIAAITILFITYDTFCQNLLSVICSLGIPGEENYLPPFNLNTHKSLIKVNQLRVCILLFLIFNLFCASYINSSSLYQSSDFDMSKLSILNNNLAQITSQTLSLEQNAIFMYQSYFTARQKIASRYMELSQSNQKHLNYVVNLNKYGNVTSPLLIHSLADDRWSATLNPNTNLGAIPYKSALPPSLLYANNNYTNFQRIKPARDMKIGPHLLNQDDNLSFVPLFSVLASHQRYCQIVTDMYSGLKDAYYSLDQFNSYDVYSANLTQKIVLSYEDIRTQLLLFNEILNDYGYTLLNTEFLRLNSRDLKLLIAFILVSILFAVAIFVQYQRTIKNLKQTLLKNNLFASLFLKKMLFS
ncbi:Transmembrane_domain-containing protein [Hexamita inflata]|uniref:Transmembrane domain-containing protein n=1 Tax=Hexamita inflata TaxID=28002 RepID=A0AA86VAJ5_9EUKA|nr:Transmembrane domain-containing protein [Hexamita inflata]